MPFLREEGRRRESTRSGLCAVENANDGGREFANMFPKSGQFPCAQDIRSEAIQLEKRYRDSLRLIEFNRLLVGALRLEQVATLISEAARELLDADGATFVVREGNRVRYAGEDAVGPLWMGQSFPIQDCVAGWTMLNHEAAVIEDVYCDARVRVEAYRPTFVTSLVMVPVGSATKVGAIGVYWERSHRTSAYELELLSSLASVADLALAGVRAFEEARHAWAEAARANQLKDEFLATLSHELRNPLNSIVSYSELLVRNPETKQLPMVCKAASAIRRNAEAQGQIISDLLDLSRLQTGKLRLTRDVISLGPVVGDAVESARASAEEKRIQLLVELCPDPLLIDADEVRVQQIVWNLVNNAVKFTPPEGRVVVSLAQVGDAAQLSVEDNGQGITSSFLPHAFEMFRQADASIKRSHSGLGIGLALVKQLVELQDGEVHAHSDGPGHGACMTVKFPLHLNVPKPEPSLNSAASSTLCGTRVLVVDDTADFLDVLASLLEGEGALVTSACGAEEALLAADRGDFDLIISDISMPAVDGYELMAKLRQNPRYARTPAIALTGFGRDDDVQRAKAASFAGHLTKPIQFAKLVELARAVLARPR